MVNRGQFTMTNVAKQSLTKAVVPKELKPLGVVFAKALCFPGASPTRPPGETGAVYYSTRV